MTLNTVSGLLSHIASEPVTLGRRKLQRLLLRPVSPSVWWQEMKELKESFRYQSHHLASQNLPALT